MSCLRAYWEPASPRVRGTVSRHWADVPWPIIQGPLVGSPFDRSRCCASLRAHSAQPLAVKCESGQAFAVNDLFNVGYDLVKLINERGYRAVREWSIVVVRKSVLPGPSNPGGSSGRLLPIIRSEAAPRINSAGDAIVSDEMVEAWFSIHALLLDEVSEHALADVALWFPIIGVAANDRSIGVLSTGNGRLPECYGA